MRYPLIRADFWISRKQRSHFVEHIPDDPDFVASKDFGDVLQRLTESGHTSALLISPTSQWEISFNPAPQEPNKPKEPTNG